MATETVCLVTR